MELFAATLHVTFNDSSNMAQFFTATLHPTFNDQLNMTRNSSANTILHSNIMFNNLSNIKF
uniref:Uncharacterized protein n=1 Tax=viral metagenome TaxID=1070528 RepID=A0A6C0CBE8_9ZZZZ